MRTTYIHRSKASQLSEMAAGRSKTSQLSEIVSEMAAERAKGVQSSQMAGERAKALQSSAMTALQSEVFQLREMAAERSIDPFEWGDKVPDSDSSYISMRYKGEWFRLGDCAEFRSGPDYMPYVGKLYRLYEGGGGLGKMVRVRWFFRARELPRFCLTVPPETMNPKEVFIALGHVKGVENENKVELPRLCLVAPVEMANPKEATILRKVTVLCTSRHRDNKLPSQDELDAADYFFSKAFDVPLNKLVAIHKIPRRQQLVKSFFNSGDV